MISRHATAGRQEEQDGLSARRARATRLEDALTWFEAVERALTR